MFQSSEDVGGHADLFSVWGTVSLVLAFQSSEDVGGHADPSGVGAQATLTPEVSFNHPKMWGDMPTAARRLLR